MSWSYNKLIWLQGWICDCGIILKRVESLTWDSCYNFHKTIQMVDVGSSLKSATWLPLPWTRRRPPLQHVASLIPPGGKILYGRCSTISGYFTAGAYHRMGEKCDSTSPDNLTHQTLTICRIHFCPRSRSKFRQHCRPNLLNYHSSLM